MADTTAPTVDFMNAGSSGPIVILVHSSVAGARQWRRLMDDLQDRFRIRAVNLFGYGKTPAWKATGRRRWKIRPVWWQRR